jgi:hypothetical protein
VVWPARSHAWGWHVAGRCGLQLWSYRYFIPTEETWLTALLNSQAIEWFYSQVSNKVRGGYMRAFSDYMREVARQQKSALPKPHGVRDAWITGRY